MEPFTNCSALILAGGKSSRMGRPKAWLEFGGVPLLTRIVGCLRESFDDIVVVHASGQEVPDVPVRLVEDEQPGLGPVAGLSVGLKAVRHELAFVCSCDVPFLNIELVRHLVTLAVNFDIVVPSWDGRLHPIHTVYRAEVAHLYERNLADGKRRPIAIYDEVRVRTVTDEELRGFDPEGRSFLNLNTPEDYEMALRMFNAI